MKYAVSTDRYIAYNDASVNYEYAIADLLERMANAEGEDNRYIINFIRSVFEEHGITIGEKS